MTEAKGGPTVDRSGASESTPDSDRESAGIAGDAAGKGGKPAPATSSADDCPAIDLDTAHDRAS
jgi:hypothetical protein